jgi:hypothetical protein
MVRTSKPINYPCITMGYYHNHYGIQFNTTVSYTPRISGKNWLFKTFPLLKSNYWSLREYGTYLTHHRKHLNPKGQKSWVRTIFSGHCIVWVNNQQTRYLALDKHNVRSGKARASVLKNAVLFLTLCRQTPNIRRLLPRRFSEFVINISWLFHDLIWSVIVITYLRLRIGKNIKCFNYNN